MPESNRKTFDKNELIKVANTINNVQGRIGYRDAASVLYAAKDEIERLEAQVTTQGLTQALRSLKRFDMEFDEASEFEGCYQPPRVYPVSYEDGEYVRWSDIEELLNATV